MAYSILRNHVYVSMTTCKWSFMSYYGHCLENKKKWSFGLATDHSCKKTKINHSIDCKEPMTSSPNFLDIALLGLYSELREQGGGDIYNKYGVEEFI